MKFQRKEQREEREGKNVIELKERERAEGT